MMDQILQYPIQYMMAIEQLLSRGQTQGEAVKPPLFNEKRKKNVWAHGLILQKSKESQRRDVGGIKRSGRLVSPQLAFYNRYSILYRQNKMDSDCYTERKVRWILKLLREVWLNVRLEKVDIHSGVSVKVLLDSRATGLFIS